MTRCDSYFTYLYRFCCKGSALSVVVEEMIEDKIDNAKVESVFDPLDFKALKEVHVVFDNFVSQSKQLQAPEPRVQLHAPVAQIVRGQYEGIVPRFTTLQNTRVINVNLN